MKGNKTSIIFLKDWAILVQSLPTEKQLVFWGLFVDYHSELECDDIIVKPIWNFVKSQLINMENKYNENIVERNKINGSKGGRPKTETNPKNPMGLNETQKTLNVNVNVNDNVKEADNNIKFNFKKSLLDLGVDLKIVNSWLDVRKIKKAVNSEIAFDAIKKEIEQSNMTANECIKISVENSWSGFKVKWLSNNKKEPEQTEQIQYNRV